jgi:hypothetical protein
VGTVIQYTQRGNDERNQRWDRVERAELCAQYGDLQAQGLSLRQAAQALDVPRSTLQAWRAYQDSLDEHPAVVAFFHSAPGLAFLHRLVLGIHLVCTEVGACGIRLVCLLVQLTGLDRFVAASYTYCISRRNFCGGKQLRGIIGVKSSTALRMNSWCTWRHREGSRNVDNTAIRRALSPLRPCGRVTADVHG